MSEPLIHSGVSNLAKYRPTKLNASVLEQKMKHAMHPGKAYRLSLQLARVYDGSTLLPGAGLQVINEPVLDCGWPLDVVIVHRLPESSHISQVAFAPWRDTYYHWIRMLLPVELLNARLISWCYQKPTDCHGIYRLGGQLLKDLDVKRHSTASATRPIIFIADQLGGLLVKLALVISLEQRHPKLTSYRQHYLNVSTVALFLLGGPISVLEEYLRVDNSIQLTKSASWRLHARLEDFENSCRHVELLNNWGLFNLRDMRLGAKQSGWCDKINVSVLIDKPQWSARSRYVQIEQIELRTQPPYLTSKLQ